MTLLLFLRSPAGNTDTGSASDGAYIPDVETLERRDLKAERKAARAAKKRIEQIARLAAEEATKQEKRKKRRREASRS